jgi:hypothetical protein
MSIAIPAYVEMIEDYAFKGCNELEHCLIDEGSVLMGIGKDAFA